MFDEAVFSDAVFDENGMPLDFRVVVNAYSCAQNFSSSFIFFNGITYLGCARSPAKDVYSRVRYYS